MNKRLFLFAAYDPDGIIDKSLIYYVQSLSKFGDIVLVMDSNASVSELKKLSPYVKYAHAVRHGEYDFGSYRRAYTYARDTAILSDYDFVYLVNDSVYGPLYDLSDYLNKMESKCYDAFGLVRNPNPKHPHIQSWFIGCKKSVFLSTWFDTFMTSITKQSDKGAITALYEQGFTQNVIKNNLSWGCLHTVAGRGVYNNVKKLYRAKMPFIKKNAFVRMHGALGGQILYILNHIPPQTRDAIEAGARRVYGDQYVSWLLTRNPIKIIARNLHHALVKTLSGKL